MRTSLVCMVASILTTSPDDDDAIVVAPSQIASITSIASVALASVPRGCGTRPAGYDIRTIQELLGHQDVSTTMIYAHVLNEESHGVRSPLDALS